MTAFGVADDSEFLSPEFINGETEKLCILVKTLDLSMDFS